MHKQTSAFLRLTLAEKSFKILKHFTKYSLLSFGFRKFFARPVIEFTGIFMYQQIGTESLSQQN